MEPMTPEDDKYIVFKRDDFYEMMGYLALPPHTAPDGSQVGGDWDCAPIAERIKTMAEGEKIDDAVVIRRQDVFAGPALYAYAHSIAVAISVITDELTKKRLQHVADYFQQQAEAASDVHSKLPGD